jgi:hypothetical protein
MVAAVLLITDFLFATVTAIAATGAVGVLFVVVWGAVPIYRRLSRERGAGT